MTITGMNRVHLTENGPWFAVCEPRTPCRNGRIKTFSKPFYLSLKNLQTGRLFLREEGRKILYFTDLHAGMKYYEHTAQGLFFGFYAMQVWATLIKMA